MNWNVVINLEIFFLFPKIMKILEWKYFDYDIKNNTARNCKIIYQEENLKMILSYSIK